MRHCPVLFQSLLRSKLILIRLVRLLVLVVKNKREIIDKTKTNIDIDDDGLVKIFGGPDADLDLAINWVKTLAGQIEIGSHYSGKIRRLAEFGLFVELVPGQDGLVHISAIPRHKQKNLGQFYKIDDVVDVEVMDYDKATGRIRLRLLEKDTNDSPKAG